MTRKLNQIRAIRERGNYNVWELPDYSKPVIVARITEPCIPRETRETLTDTVTQRRREQATTNIQWRILQRLVLFHAADDGVAEMLECSDAEWQQLVDLMNIAD